MIAKNMLGITPYTDQFYGMVIENICRVLSKESVQNIQIELKYAEFKYLTIGVNEDYRNVPEPLRQRLLEGEAYKQEIFRQNLGVLSKQHILVLNPLGRHIYCVSSGFNQPLYRKYYHIRDLLAKVAAFNAIGRLPRKEGEPRSIYHDMAANNNNHQLQVVEENELRMDVYIKDYAPEALRGRYSFTSKAGWSKVKKDPLCPQIDYMLSQRTFRFAINKEIEDIPEPQDIDCIAGLLRSKPKVCDIRLKRIMRVLKGKISEYSLSEIYNINDITNFIDLPEKMEGTNAGLEAYLRKIFINFYSEHEADKIKWEIESEFTKQHTELLKKLVLAGRLSDIKAEIESAVEELYCLFYADHTTKVREVEWLNHRVPDLPSTRLENEFGNYMREELYQQMHRK